MAKTDFDSLIDVLLKLRTRKELSSFLRALLTVQECEELPKRLAIVRLLKKGVPQHEIARRLGVGIATVTRGSKEVAQGHFKSV